MWRRLRDRRGFTGVELLVVVVVVAILGGSAAGTRIYLRNQAAQRVVENDLEAFASAQIAAKAETGRFIPYSQMAANVESSDDVEISSVAVAPDRIFVRMRHRVTGYACAVDLTPESRVARNRMVCAGSADDPAVAAPPDVLIATNPGDTATVALPVAPPQVVEDPSLLAEVGDPAELVLAPGATGVIEYPVTNRGARENQFGFAVSSANPAVVPQPAPPAAAMIGGGETALIPVGVSMPSGIPADEFSLVALRAGNVGDGARGATGVARVRTALVLEAPSIAAPSAEVRDNGETFNVTYQVTNRTNATRSLSHEAVLPAGSALSVVSGGGTATYRPFEMKPRAYTYRLSAPTCSGGQVYSTQVAAADVASPSHRGVSSPGYEVTVRPEFGPASIGSPPAREGASPGAEFTMRWSVSHASNVPRVVTVTPAVSGDLEIVTSSHTGPVSVACQQVLAVDVVYRLRRGARHPGASEASVTVVDPDQGSVTQRVTVTTPLVLGAPVVSQPADRSDRPGASFTQSYQVTNGSNGARSLLIDASPSGDVVVESFTIDGIGVVTAGEVVPFASYESRWVRVGYRVKDRSVHGTRSHPILQVADAVAPSHGAQRAFTETTALHLCAPTLSAPSGVPAQPQVPGTTAQVSYTVQACSNAARTYAAVVRSSNPGAVADPGDPAPVTIPAYGSAEVSFVFGIAPHAYGGVSADLAVEARDREEASLVGIGGFRVTPTVIRAAPRLSALVDQALLPGEPGTAAGTLVSQSNVAVRYCLRAAVAPGSVGPGMVVPEPAPGSCVDIGAPFGSASVTQPFSVAPGAEHPWTNQVTVHAVDQNAGDLTASRAFVVTAGLQLANPTIRVPTAAYVEWNVGDTQAIEYRTSNQANAERTLCLDVTPGDGSLAAVTAGPICAVVGARKPHTFVHQLRAAGASDGVRVVARVYDQAAPSYHAEGSYNNRVNDAKPIAVWTTPETAPVRRWVDFDGGGSFSPIGRPIVRYVWSWGLPYQSWDGTRFVPSDAPVATDEVAQAAVRRAYDIRGTFRICLTVVDADGRTSVPNCNELTTQVMTRARLQWRYRGWWYSRKDLCLDVFWDNQCPKDHGNARWEILLGASQGDVPIRRAWATFSIDWWQTDDQFGRTYSYAGNSDPVASATHPDVSGVKGYDFYSNAQKATGGVSHGNWRVLDTNGSAPGGWPQAPNLAQHPLVLNANLGEATGSFDGGPHWAPDSARVTLYVEDANGTVTSVSGRQDHFKAEWRGHECINGTSGWGCTKGWERLVSPPVPPKASMDLQRSGAAPYHTYRATGSGESLEGRVVDAYWEVEEQPVDPRSGPGDRYTSRDRELTLRAKDCTRQIVLFMVRDDQGRLGSAFEVIPAVGSAAQCYNDPGGSGRPVRPVAI